MCRGPDRDDRFPEGGAGEDEGGSPNKNMFLVFLSVYSNLILLCLKICLREFASCFRIYSELELAVFAEIQHVRKVC